MTYLLLCAECGINLFPDDYSPPFDTIYYMNYKYTMYSCYECNHIGAPLVRKKEELNEDTQLQ